MTAFVIAGVRKGFGRPASAGFRPEPSAFFRQSASSICSSVRYSSSASDPVRSGRHASGARAAWIGLIAVGLGLVAARGHAMSADGALVTNTVTATYNGLAGIGSPYAVSYNASAYVLVSCPVIFVQKIGTPTQQVTGGTVTFQLWVVNTSLGASAFNVVLTDRLPDGTGYVNPAPAQWDPSGTWYASFGTAVAGPYAAGQPANGQTSSPTPEYLSWSADIIGPGRSALVTYLVTIQ